MEENFKNKLGLFSFVFFVFVLLVGGFFLTKCLSNNKKEEPKEAYNFKIDNDKDYIYYEDEEVISEEVNIFYKNVVINLNTQKVLNEGINKETEAYKNNIIHISEVDSINKEMINYDNDNLYALTFRNFNDYRFGKYISLLIEDYNYSCFNGVTFNKSKSYVFNTEDASLLSSNDLLIMYNKTISDVSLSVRNYLNNKQSQIDGENVIKIDETLEGLNVSSLFINNYGKLSISYLVKTTQVDYNEITEV